MVNEFVSGFEWMLISLALCPPTEIILVLIAVLLNVLDSKVIHDLIYKNRSCVIIDRLEGDNVVDSVC